MKQENRLTGETYLENGEKIIFAISVMVMDNEKQIENGFVYSNCVGNPIQQIIAKLYAYENLGSVETFEHLIDTADKCDYCEFALGGTIEDVEMRAERKNVR